MESAPVPTINYDKLLSIYLSLSAMSDNHGGSRPDLNPRARKTLAKEMLRSLPGNVTTIDLGEGLTVSRPEEEFQNIPVDQRQAWTLPQVDAYAADLAQSIKEPWVPIFQPPTPIEQ